MRFVQFSFQIGNFRFKFGNRRVFAPYSAQEFQESSVSFHFTVFVGAVVVDRLGSGRLATTQHAN